MVSALRTIVVLKSHGMVTTHARAGFGWHRFDTCTCGCWSRHRQHWHEHSPMPSKQKAPEVSGLRGSQRSHCNVRLPRRLYAQIAGNSLDGVTFRNLRHRRFHACHRLAHNPCPTHGQTRHAARGAVGRGVKLGPMVEHGSCSTVMTSLAADSYAI
jgi:hypothetical protein